VGRRPGTIVTKQGGGGGGALRVGLAPGGVGRSVRGWWAEEEEEEKEK